MQQDPGTDAVISSVHSDFQLPFKMAPLIFVSTVITHLFGGSAGREGAALQIGGSVVGGCLIIALTLLIGSYDYNGAGMQIVEKAIEGEARPEAFALKLVFTMITLACGYKGGEIVPSFFVGATFGAVVGGLLHLPAGFGAVIGLISVFCGAVNCPLASIILSVELFGAEYLPLFGLSCAISYTLSGYFGLYGTQTILYSKIKTKYINRFTH